MPKRQPKPQPTPEQVAETVRTNSQELYKHFDQMIEGMDNKDVHPYTSALAANEALGTLAYSIPPAAVDALVDATMRVVGAMDALRTFNLMVQQWRSLCEPLKKPSDFDYAHVFDGFNRILTPSPAREVRNGTDTPTTHA